MKKYIIVVLLIFAQKAFPLMQADSLFFIGNELLCRPTANSVSVNICTNKAVDFYYQYGTDTLNYTLQTPVTRSVDSIASTTVISGLQANKKYFYRLWYKLPSAQTYSKKPNRTFRTQRARGSAFTYAIEADPHMDTNSLASVYQLTLQNILAKQPDFLLDLGDTFMSEKLPVVSALETKKRHILLRSFFDITTHSVPLFLVQGNHDGELGWRIDNTGDNLPIWNTTNRKMYYPNPVPDNFYSGNSVSEPYVGLRENYYAFEWGDALIIVLDPYWYTKTKPNWGWTLGAAQYQWFKNTITSSTAKFKFVFCHQLVGGNTTDGRGGSEYAHLWENGGRNADSTWGFDANRPGWQKPIHQLMVENGGNIFFHGHDHLYAKQELDGVIYQETPQPSLKNYTSTSSTAYGYLNGVILPNRGYLLVSVSDTAAKVEYYRTYLPSEENGTRHNGDISHSYTIYPRGTTKVSEYMPDASGYDMISNYPNPFNPSTTINYSIARSGNTQLVLYNALGQEITTLVNGYTDAGTYKLEINPSELRMPAGVYFCRLTTISGNRIIKLLYLK